MTACYQNIPLNPKTASFSRILLEAAVLTLQIQLQRCVTAFDRNSNSLGSHVTQIWRRCDFVRKGKLCRLVDILGEIGWVGARKGKLAVRKMRRRYEATIRRRRWCFDFSAENSYHCLSQKVVYVVNKFLGCLQPKPLIRTFWNSGDFIGMSRVEGAYKEVVSAGV